MAVTSILPEWQKIETGGGWGTGHWAIFRDERLKVQCEVYTPVNAASGRMGEGRVRYYIDGDDREFEDEDELKKAYSEGLI
jgi:hypothetical protein